MNAHQMIDATLLNVIGQAVPRYTSYPTAPHFSSAVNGKTIAAWLETAAASRPEISLYLHVPYCRAICHYCGCATKATRKEAPIRHYAMMLRREIALAADHIGRARVTHIHWGRWHAQPVAASRFWGNPR